MVAIIRLVSLATIAVAAWLASVVVLVLPARDPGHVGLWAVVAVGAASFAVLSLAVASRAARPNLAASLGLSALAVASLGFGLVAIASELTRTDRSEGYLLAIGLILATHGAVVLGWLAARFVTIRAHR